MAEILDLQTKAERATVKIDGAAYELILPSDLDLEEAIWLEKAGRRISVLEESLKDDDRNEEAAVQLRKLLVRFVRILLRDAPEEVLGRLSDVHRLAIVNAYSKRIIEEKKDFFGAAGASSSGAQRPTGSTSSPRSSGSTADPPQPG